MFIARNYAVHSLLASLLLSTSLFSLSTQAAAEDCPPAAGNVIEITSGMNVDEYCEVPENGSLIVRTGGAIDVGLGGLAIAIASGEVNSAQSITIEQGANVTGSTWIESDRALTGDFIINGALLSNGNTIEIEGQAGDLLIGDTGSVVNTTDGPAIIVSGTGSVGTIWNNGQIQTQGEGAALNIEGASFGNIRNFGTIEAVHGGLKIDVNTASVGQIWNSGTIRQSDKTQGVAVDVNNAHANGLTVINSGLIDGHIRLDNAYLYLNGTGTPDFEMAITGDILGTDNTNIILGHVTGADYILEGAIKANEFLVQETSSLAFNQTSMDVNRLYNNGGLVNLERNAVSVTGDYRQVGGRLGLEAQTLSDYGSLLVGGEASFEDGAEIYLDVTTSTIDFAKKNQLTSVVTAASFDVLDLSITSNSVLYDFDYLIDGNDLHITFGLEDNGGDNGGEGSVGGVQKRADTAGQGAGRTIDYIMANNPNGNFDDVINAFGHLTTDQEVTDAVTQTLPVMGANTTQAALNTMHTTGRIVQARQDGNEGISSGDTLVSGGNAWLKPFGSWAKQKSTSGYTGFESDGYGLMAGVDGIVSDHARLGVALAYAHSKLKGLDAARTQKVDTNAYHATVYGSYVVGANTELNARIGAGFGKNEGRSVIAFGGANTVAKSDYDSLFLDASLGLGHTISVGQSTTLTPSARLDYLYVHNKAYTQTGAGGFNQRVNAQTTDQLVPTLDAKLYHKVTDAMGVAVNLGVGYDVLNERSQITSQFVGGGPAFSTQGAKTSPWVTNAGVGMTFNPGASMELSARYDAEMRGSDYHNQSVSLKIRAPF